MLNRKQNEENTSSITFYNDGLGFKGYSLRLSNMSLNRLTNNIAHFVGWSAGIGLTMGKHMFGLVASNDHTHYLLRYNNRGLGNMLAPFDTHALIETISQGNCNISYDIARQAEYYQLPLQRIYSIENREIHFNLILDLYRGCLEPILQTSEECLIELLKTAYTTWEQAAIEQQLKNDIADDELRSKLQSFALLGLGLFAGGNMLKHAWDWNKNRNKLSEESVTQENTNQHLRRR